MQAHLNSIGILLVILAMVHAVFPRYFNWKQELAGLSIINRQLMYVHAFFIAFIVLLIGLLCLTSADLLIETSLGRRLSLGLSIFWTVRLLIQFFGYTSKTWKGKRFETAVHVLFSFFWAYLSVFFWLVFLGM